MLTLKLISEETERVIAGLEKKHFKGAREAIENVLAIDKRRREAQRELDNTKMHAKQMAAQIGSLMKQGKREEAEAAKNEVSKLKQRDKELEEQMANAEKEMTALLCTIPNIPNEIVPEGADASGNIVVKEGGEKPQLPEGALCHWDLCKKYNLIDFDLGVKITGSGFPVYIGKMKSMTSFSSTYLPLRLSSLRRPARAAIWRFSLPM